MILWCAISRQRIILCQVLEAIYSIGNRGALHPIYGYGHGMQDRRPGTWNHSRRLLQRQQEARNLEPLQKTAAEAAGGQELGTTPEDCCRGSRRPGTWNHSRRLLQRQQEARNLEPLQKTAAEAAGGQELGTTPEDCCRGSRRPGTWNHSRRLLQRQQEARNLVHIRPLFVDLVFLIPARILQPKKLPLHIILTAHAQR